MIEAELASNFDKADEDKDQKLNLAEFQKFMRYNEECFITRTGGAVQTTEEDNKQTFDATNTLSEGEGVSLEDYKKSKKLYTVIMQRIIAQN